jgi:glutamate racemase
MAERPQRERPIGVFDSGIGGLTVVRHILDRLPGEDIVYFGDSARVPYGTKSPETVIRFSHENTRFLLRRGVKFLVVACNTSSAVAMESLERNFDVPMVGVIEPAVEQALAATRKGVVGVIGTRATVGSGAYERGLKRRDPAVEVVSRACPLFVPLAEEGWFDGPVVEEVARIYLEPIVASGADVLILGCTHYPLLREVIARVVGPGVRLVESGEAAVEVMRQRLGELGLLKPGDGRGGRARYYVSDIPLRFQEIGERFLGRPLGEVTRVEQADLPWYER